MLLFWSRILPDALYNDRVFSQYEKSIFSALITRKKENNKSKKINSTYDEVNIFILKIIYCNTCFHNIQSRSQVIHFREIF